MLFIDYETDSIIRESSTQTEVTPIKTNNPF